MGYFNPSARGQEKRILINLERAEHWIETGAQPSPRVKDLLKEFKAGPEVREAKLAKKDKKAQEKKEAKILTEATAAKESEDNAESE